MPLSTASRKGISAVAAASETERIVLTNHGRAVAVVDSAERLDEQARLVRQACQAVLDSAADLVAERGKRFDLDDACLRLGLDPARVRARISESTR